MPALARNSRWLSRFKHSPFRYPHFSQLFSSAAAQEPEKPIPSGPPPIRVGITDSAGRGVFATRRIGAGEQIHTAKPVVCYPSLSSINTVCYFCLKKLNSNGFDNLAVGFCSQECKENAKVFYDVETKADWSAFDDYCRNQALKYPLMLKRLACMVISGAASAESLDILQPASLTPEMILKGFTLLSSPDCLPYAASAIPKLGFFSVPVSNQA